MTDQYQTREQEYPYGDISLNLNWLINVIFWRRWEIQGRPRTVKRERNGKDRRLVSRTNPACHQCSSKTTIYVLIKRKTHHGHKKYIHENWKINAVVKEMFRPLMEDVKLLGE